MSDDTAVTPGEAAREEAARQLVILLFGLAGAIAFVWVQRSTADPDLARSWRMRAAKASERAHARLARWAWGRAEAARLAYEGERA